MKEKLLEDNSKKYKVSRASTMAKERESGLSGGYARILDLHIHEETPDLKVLPWQEFTRNFKSEDTEYDDVIKSLIAVNPGASIDMRPYMIQNPFSVFTTDPLKKCLDVFRLHHLRHLIVIEPTNGKLTGIITR